MKQILPGLLIFLIIAPVVCAETCDIKLEIGEEGTCGNYKIRHDSFDDGDKHTRQIAHFHIWRLSPYADLGSDSLDFCMNPMGRTTMATNYVWITRDPVLVLLEWLNMYLRISRRNWW